MREKPADFILPDFGGHHGPTAAGAPAAATSGEAAPSGPRKMALICSKGNLDMAYPGLILGNAAAGEGIETHIFFTFWGLDIVNRKRYRNLQFTMVGNTSMHMPELGYVRPGWEHLSMPQFVGRIPGMTKIATAMMRRQIADLEVPDVPDFVDLIAAAGVHMYACKMTYDMQKLIEADLHPAVEGVISAADFIEISAGAQTIFI